MRGLDKHRRMSTITPAAVLALPGHPSRSVPCDKSLVSHPRSSGSAFGLRLSPWHLSTLIYLDLYLPRLSCLSLLDRSCRLASLGHRPPAIFRTVAQPLGAPRLSWCGSAGRKLDPRSLDPRSSNLSSTFVSWESTEPPCHLLWITLSQTTKPSIGTSSQKGTKRTPHFAGQSHVARPSTHHHPWLMLRTT